MGKCTFKSDASVERGEPRKRKGENEKVKRSIRRRKEDRHEIKIKTNT